MITTSDLATAVPEPQAVPPAAPVVALPPAAPPPAQLGLSAQIRAASAEAKKAYEAQGVNEITFNPAVEAPSAPAAPPTAPAEAPATPERPRDPTTGQFLPTEAVPAASTPAPADAVAAGAESGADGAPTDASLPAPVPEPIVVALPPLRTGEKPVDIEVTDPDVAEHLRMLANNGLRRDELNRRLEGVITRESDLRAFETTFTQAPEVIVGRMPHETQLRIARYLMANQFEALKPDMEAWYQDPTALREARVDQKEYISKQSGKIDEYTTVERKAGQVLSVVEGMIPNNASLEDANDFVREARVKLAGISGEREARTGNGDITLDEVKSILTRHLTRYGWDKPQAIVTTSAVSTATPGAPTVAVPLGEAALALASEAKRAQARRVDAQAARAVASKIAPAGVGGVPATAPQLPPNATFKDAAKFLRANQEHYFKTTA